MADYVQEITVLSNSATITIAGPGAFYFDRMTKDKYKNDDDGIIRVASAPGLIAGTTNFTIRADSLNNIMTSCVYDTAISRGSFGGQPLTIADEIKLVDQLTLRLSILLDIARVTETGAKIRLDKCESFAAGSEDAQNYANECLSYKMLAAAALTKIEGYQDPEAMATATGYLTTVTEYAQKAALHASPVIEPTPPVVEPTPPVVEPTPPIVEPVKKAQINNLLIDVIPEIKNHPAGLKGLVGLLIKPEDKKRLESLFANRDTPYKNEPVAVGQYGVTTAGEYQIYGVPRAELGTITENAVKNALSGSPSNTEADVIMLLLGNYCTKEQLMGILTSAKTEASNKRNECLTKPSDTAESEESAKLCLQALVVAKSSVEMLNKIGSPPADIEAAKAQLKAIDAYAREAEQHASPTIHYTSASIQSVQTPPGDFVTMVIAEDALRELQKGRGGFNPGWLIENPPYSTTPLFRDGMEIAGRHIEVKNENMRTITEELTKKVWSAEGYLPLRPVDVLVLIQSPSVNNPQSLAIIGSYAKFRAEVCARKCKELEPGSEDAEHHASRARDAVGFIEIVLQKIKGLSPSDQARITSVEAYLAATQDAARTAEEYINSRPGISAGV